MFVLDTNTVMISAATINFGVGAFMLVFFSGRADLVRAHWSLALIFYGIAGLLIGYREGLPPWLANVIANMLVGFSVVLIHRGVWIMIGKRPPDRLYLLSVIFVGCIYYQFTYLTPNAGIRLFTISMFRVPYFISAAWALSRSQPYRAVFGTKALISLLFLGGVWYFFRGALALGSELWIATIQLGAMQSANFLVAATMNLLITLALSRVEAQRAIRHASELARQLKAQSDGFEAAVKTRTRELEQEVVERKRTEGALKAACARAEEALENMLVSKNTLVQSEKMGSLGRLVAGTSYEISSPLGVSVTMASLLSERIRDLSVSFEAGRLRKGDMARFLRDAQEGMDLQLTNLQRAADLVRVLKQVAADQAQDECRRFDLGGCLSDIVVCLTPVWRPSGHRVDILCPEPIEVDSYPGALSQILTNLVTNSVVHGFECGQTGRLTIAAALAGTEIVELTYSDTGKGLPPEVEGAVFQAFVTTRRNLGSTGLGLHIVHDLVVGTLGGGIEMRSEVGRGVRFVMRFPRSIAPPSSAS